MKTNIQKINFYATAIMLSAVTVFAILVVIAVKNNNL